MEDRILSALATGRRDGFGGASSAPAELAGSAAMAAPPRVVLFQRISQETGCELRLCAALEAMADRLPQICGSCYTRLGDALCRGCHEDRRGATRSLFQRLIDAPNEEAGVLLPALAQASSRASADRGEDETTAFELAEALQTAAARGRAGNAAALGYMMRGYFEPRRRRLAWEAAAILEPAKLMLSDADCARLLNAAPADPAPDRAADIAALCARCLDG